MNKAISVSTGPIFTIFSPNGRYLHEYSRSGPVFPILKGRCHGNQFCGKITYPPALIALSFRNGIALRICAFIAPLIALHCVKRW